jgi:hypothetical protein
MPQSVRIVLDLSDNEALELAQFVKRIGWDHFRSCAVDDEEAYAIRDSVVKLERALSAAGYTPR